MKKIFSIAFLLFATIYSQAQLAGISPPLPSVRTGSQVNFTGTAIFGLGTTSAAKTFTWTIISGPAPASPQGPVTNFVFSGNTNTQAFTFLTAGTYEVRVTITTITGPSAGNTASASTMVTVWTPNLYSTSGTGSVKAWNINPVTGVVINGPDDLFIPSFSTAALAKNQPMPLTDPEGYLYWLPNNGANGIVTVNAHHPSGTGTSVTVATFDFNGPANNNSLGFVRLAIDPFGWGWILAGDGLNLYLGKFQALGPNSTQSTIQVVNSSVQVAGGGSVADFQNGDIAFAANGVLYALANVTGGVTGIYSMNTTSQTGTLTKRWTLLDNNGNNFPGSVNGVAFSINGSLHISTSGGLFFIDQATANTSSGTVQCSEVNTIDGLTDLASDRFPQQTTLPVTLISFNGRMNNGKAILTWVTEDEINFSHYEIEKSSNGRDFHMAGSIAARQSTSQTSYNFTDPSPYLPLTYYRLRMVDINGTFRYSLILPLQQTNALRKAWVSHSSANQMALYVKSTLDESFNMEVVDAAGKIVESGILRASGGITIVPLKYHPAKGVYFVRIYNGNEMLVISFYQF